MINVLHPDDLRGPHPDVQGAVIVLTARGSATPPLRFSELMAFAKRAQGQVSVISISTEDIVYDIVYDVSSAPPMKIRFELGGKACVVDGRLSGMLTATVHGRRVTVTGDYTSYDAVDDLRVLLRVICPTDLGFEGAGDPRAYADILHGTPGVRVLRVFTHEHSRALAEAAVDYAPGLDALAYEDSHAFARAIEERLPRDMYRILRPVPAAPRIFRTPQDAMAALTNPAARPAAVAMLLRTKKFIPREALGLLLVASEVGGSHDAALAIAKLLLVHPPEDGACVAEMERLYIEHSDADEIALPALSALATRGHVISQSTRAILMHSPQPLADYGRACALNVLASSGTPDAFASAACALAYSHDSRARAPVAHCLSLATRTCDGMLLALRVLLPGCAEYVAIAAERLATVIDEDAQGILDGLSAALPRGGERSLSAIAALIERGGRPPAGMQHVLRRVQPSAARDRVMGLT